VGVLAQRRRDTERNFLNTENSRARAEEKQRFCERKKSGRVRPSLDSPHHDIVNLFPFSLYLRAPCLCVKKPLHPEND
jgi:hypothetical protein